MKDRGDLKGLTRFRHNLLFSPPIKKAKGGYERRVESSLRGRRSKGKG